MYDKYISPADTAKLIRTQLKRHFPNTKFWVQTKTYSGGASIDITWIDGPRQSQVESVTSAFSGAGFDGMNDYKTSHDAYLLPDGSAAPSEIERDLYTTQKFTAPDTNAERVHFGADYIFCNRKYSPAVKPIIEETCKKWGKSAPKYYEHTPFIGSREHTELNTIDWDCNEWWPDHNITISIREALDIDMSNNPPLETKPVIQEEIQVTYDREWTWIKFPVKPSQAALDILKNTIKARWSQKRNAWYICEPVTENEIRIKLAVC